MDPIEVNLENFEEKVLKSKKLVLVDFFATWCGPCKMLAPVLEEVCKEVKDVTIAKLDVDESLDLAKEYGVMSVPTVIFFKEGKEIDRFSGYRQKTQILEAIDKNK